MQVIVGMGENLGGALAGGIGGQRVIGGIVFSEGEPLRFAVDGRGRRLYEDVRAVARYIIANPLRAGLCERIGDYPLWDAAWL